MSIVKDMSLAPSGQRKIDWVRSFMPALSQIEARFAREKPFSGLRAAVSVHLEAKTANLALVLQEGGAKVYLTGCNPLSTQDDVAAAVAQRGVETFGLHGVTPEQYAQVPPPHRHRRRRRPGGAAHWAVQRVRRLRHRRL